MPIRFGRSRYSRGRLTAAGPALGILRNALGSAGGVAASGQPFDYPPAIRITNTDGSTNTADNTTVVTVSITSGAGSLVGTVTKTAVNGIADFGANIGSGTNYVNNALGISGVGTYAITYSAPGHASVTDNPITTVAPQWDAFALTLGLTIELPRSIPDTTYPTISSSVTVGASGRTYTSVQAALNALVAADTPLHREIICDDATTVGTSIVAPARAPGMGKIVIRPATMPPSGRMVAGSSAQLALPKITSENAQGIFQCEDGTHDIWCVGIWFDVPVPAAGDSTEIFVAVDFTPQSTVTLANMPYNMGLDRCYIHGKPTCRLRKGVAMECGAAFITNTSIDEVHDFFDPTHGTGVGSVIGGVSHYGNSNADTNAVFCVFGSGPHYYFNNSFEAAGEVSLYGGTDPTVPYLIPGDITWLNNRTQKPLAWQNIYPAKNNWELKNARRVLVDGHVFDGSWAAAQDGTGILMGSVNQSDTSPWCGVLDVTLRNSFARNMTALFTLTRNNSQVGDMIAQPAQRISIHDVVGANINGMESGAGDDIDRIMLVVGITNCCIRHVTAVAEIGNSTKALILDVPNSNTTIDDNILTCEHYGILATGDAPGTPSISASLPGDTFAGNVLIGVGQDGAVSTSNFPSIDFFPAANANVGFVNTAPISGSWVTDTPTSVCAALALAASGTYSGKASDGKDPGANMTAVIAAITGV